MFDISVESVCHVIAQARALALGGDADGEEHEPDAHGHEDLVEVVAEPLGTPRGHVVRGHDKGVALEDQMAGGMISEVVHQTEHLFVMRKKST